MTQDDPYVHRLTAWGHVNVSAKHSTTIEITKEDHLTPQGDCIIAVSADKGLTDLPADFLEALKDEKAKLVIEIECGGAKERITAHGHPDLTFTNPHEMVVRKSDYICGRTLAIGADKASKDMDRKLISNLARCAEARITLILAK
jgi:uncharacterized protein